MKRLKYKLIVLTGVLGLITFYACKKNFLDKTPQGALNPSTVANKAGVEAILVGAYHALLGEVNWGSAPSNWTFGSVCGGDSYKGSVPSDQGDITNLENYAYSVSNPYLDQKWLGLYHGVQRANDVLRNMALATDIPADDQKVLAGEARFLRGYWHLEGKKLWKNVPYVDESVTPANADSVSNLDASGNFVDIYPQIEADFQFAIDNLPETQPQPGRANKWAAVAFLAKTYMFEHKYAEAKALFDQVIASGKTAKGDKYALVKFEANFNASTDNTAESVFAVQASVNDGSGTNGNYGDNLNFPNSGGPGGCCGFNNPSISLANSYKTGSDGLPLFTTFNTGPNVSDPNATPYSGTLDPRIDWTVGRTGIPYLDWGPYPKNTWIRDVSTDGWMNPKKNVYAKSQTGTTSSTETSFWGPTQMDATNVNLMRFSDVLLMAAEAEVEVGSLHQATLYVNMVRNRAADPLGWVYNNAKYNTATGTYDTTGAVPKSTPADKYLIKPYPADFASAAAARQAIMFERKLELAIEGHRFFDLQRWDGVGGFSMADELNAYIAAEKSRNGFFSFNQSATFTKGKNEIYPIYVGEIDIANAKGKILLKQNPGY